MRERKIELKFDQQKLVLILLIFLVIGFSVVKPEFINARSLDNIIRTFSMYGISALGMTMVILTGGTDLSAGSNMALAGVVGAGLLGNAFNAANPIKMPFILTVVFALLACGLIGLLNGICISKLHMAPFVATLATMSLSRGLVYVVADFVVQGVSGSPITFMNDGYYMLGLGDICGIPFQLIVYVVIFVIIYIILKYTRLGRAIYTVGGNTEVARLAGMKPDAIILICYTFCGILAGLAGTILVGKLSSASTVAAQGYELDLITAVALGGTSMEGGKGGIIGTLIGTAFLAVMNTGMDMVNIPSFYQYLIKGMILVFAVYMDTFFQKHRKSN